MRILRLGSSKSSGKINPRQIHKEYLDKHEKELEEQGVVFFDSDNLNIKDEFLTLPSDITEVHSRELGQYLNTFTQQKLYLRTLLGRTEHLSELARREYLEVSSSMYKRYSFDKMTETAKDRIINGDEKVRPFYEKYMDWKHKVALVTNSIASIEDVVFLISREVTRRDSDFGDENRSHNVGRK